MIPGDADGTDPLAVAREELARRAGFARTTEEGDRWRWGQFANWCEGAGVMALPCSEETLLAYLRLHAATWSWGHARCVADAIRRHHKARHMPSPVGPRVKGHLREVGARLGRVALPFMDPLRVTDLEQVIASLQAPEARPGPGVAIMRAAIASAGLLDLPMQVRGRPDVSGFVACRVRYDGDVVVVRGPGGRAAVADARHTPWEHRVLTAAREHLADGVLGPVPLRTAPGVSVALAWHRAGWGRPPEALAPAELSEKDRSWLAACLDRGVALRRRNVAYLLVGVLLAVRHQDLAVNLNLHGVREDPAGFWLRFDRSKADQEGLRGPRALPHLEAPGQGRHPLCPACALADHLQVVAAQGRQEGPVFATLYAGQWAPMTRQNGRLVVQAAWRAAGLDPTARIGTRSLRSGGATSAYEAGWSTAQIAADLTLHSSLDEAARYIRVEGPDPFHLVL